MGKYPITKELLEKLYATMSMDEMAEQLSISKYIVYTRLKEFGIPIRSKSQAQKRQKVHQRKGKKHTLESRAKISKTMDKFWTSSDGENYRAKLSKFKRKEWDEKKKKKKVFIINRLLNAEKPKPGHLSKFGEILAAFLAEREQVSTGIKITSNHISDIILQDQKVVIELLLPMDVYGKEQERKLKERYSQLQEELFASGYRLVVIQDRSTSRSQARCQRIYTKLQKFFKSNQKRLDITS